MMRRRTERLPRRAMADASEGLGGMSRETITGSRTTLTFLIQQEDPDKGTIQEQLVPSASRHDSPQEAHPG